MDIWSPNFSFSAMMQLTSLKLLSSFGVDSDIVEKLRWKTYFKINWMNSHDVQKKKTLAISPSHEGMNGKWFLHSAFLYTTCLIHT